MVEQTVVIITRMFFSNEFARHVSIIYTFLLCCHKQDITAVSGLLQEKFLWKNQIQHFSQAENQSRSTIVAITTTMLPTTSTRQMDNYNLLTSILEVLRRKLYGK